MKIVLLPGLDGTGVLFKPLIEALPNRADIQVISYPSKTKLSYKELTELVVSQLPKEKFILVGESFSGYIAYQVALSKPKNLKSLVFVAAFLGSPRPFFLGLSSWFPRSHILSVPIPTYIIRLFLFGSAVNKKMVGLFKKAMTQVSPYVLSYRLQEVAKISNNYKFSEIRAIYIYKPLMINLYPRNV